MSNEFHNYTVDEIIGFLQPSENLLNERRFTLSEKEFFNLISRINNLADQFNLHQNVERQSKWHKLSCVLRGLADIRHNYYTLKSRLDINNLIWDLDKNLEQSSQEDMADIIKACTDLGYDKGELSWDPELLSKWINLNLNSFSPKNSLILLHSFAKLGYEASDNFIVSLKKLARRAKTAAGRFSPTNVVDLIHSLAKSNMFDELFDERTGELSEMSIRAKETISNSYNIINPKTSFAIL